MKTLIDIYLTRMRIDTAVMMQYRFAFFLWIIGMAFEPVIYLVIWTTIALQEGGAVGGYTVAEFTMYYIAWTLVRQMNIGYTPYEFENRVQRGGWSPRLLQPIHPFHIDLAGFNGFKFVTFLLWIPIGIILYLIFKPEFTFNFVDTMLFTISLFTGYLMRFAVLWVLGLITFWITRISAIFDLYFGLELFLSGRLIPVSLLPDWAQSIGNWLPYQWAFGFPLDLLLGKLTTQQILLGFFAQAVWFVLALGVINILWRLGIKKYTAVGA